MLTIGERRQLHHLPEERILNHSSVYLTEFFFDFIYSGSSQENNLEISDRRRKQFSYNLNYRINNLT